ncbi:MFS transporter small subunit [Mesorhizobium comanense]
MLQDNSNQIKLTLAWLLVGIPLVWGFWMTLMSAAALFR